MGQGAQAHWYAGLSQFHTVSLTLWVLEFLTLWYGGLSLFGTRVANGWYSGLRWVCTGVPGTVVLYGLKPVNHMHWYKDSIRFGTGVPISLALGPIWLSEEVPYGLVQKDRYGLVQGDTYGVIQRLPYGLMQGDPHALVPHALV